jgi:uncharacterized protein CbrC (UPF0167 family)
MPTIFTCRCCPASVGGNTDGTAASPGWYRIDGIDGPDAICPACVADPSAMDGLREDGYRPRIGDPMYFTDGEREEWAEEERHLSLAWTR